MQTKYLISAPLKNKKKESVEKVAGVDIQTTSLDNSVGFFINKDNKGKILTGAIIAMIGIMIFSISINLKENKKINNYIDKIILILSSGFLAYYVFTFLGSLIGYYMTIIPQLYKVLAIFTPIFIYFFAVTVLFYVTTITYYLYKVLHFNRYLKK